ncbi:hypothetical protein KAFR_0B05270 [Kazachstania africana CBS 2517]|uniref:PWWP domain-containing protein n=1 Tax=Kazachstania africana (strain ATCC 22294 / BCRC 22015 / CBS 2517 / CECT 1963 / NBRC 1671 / NRRL Y-8276) TaxID=1071382 RepID=H2AR22_KAZAF|nr:hypothetical protein KAFR_0B05270 [Kazachstania africana CBS 2517]CCF56822.1 hypothetical protein KAFR_0B05270 [Kazachstania africana CBS 2517]
MSDHIYQPTDIVLVKVKGYSAWPSMIVPIELIPTNVLKSHSEDFEYDSNDDEYIEITKFLKFKKFKGKKDLYCVKFFNDDSYIWVKHNDLKLLDSKDCEDWIVENQNKRHNKKLIPAYEMALNILRNDPDAIDVYEFIEYGSKGKPNDDDDDEYIEEKVHARSKRKGTRSSSRQRQKKQKFQSEEEEDEIEDVSDYEEPSSRRRTRKSLRTSRRNKQEEAVSDFEVLEAAEVKPVRGRGRAKSTPVKSKTFHKTKKVAPKVVKYNYEDDEDWKIVGMGPQDTAVKVNPLVNKLRQKKNQEKHTELRLDLIDKINSINTLLFDLIVPVLSETEEKTTPRKDDYEIILDEFEIALNMNGTNNEFISIFRSNNELLLNFRALLNLRTNELNDWNLWNKFQGIFASIYECEFIIDEQEWSLRKEENQNEAEATNDTINGIELSDKMKQDGEMVN